MAIFGKIIRSNKNVDRVAHQAINKTSASLHKNYPTTNVHL